MLSSFFPTCVTLRTVEIVFLTAHLAHFALVTVPATFLGKSVVVNNTGRAEIGAEFQFTAFTFRLHDLN